MFANKAAGCAIVMPVAIIMVDGRTHGMFNR